MILSLQFTSTRNIILQNTGAGTHTLRIGTSGIQLDPGARAVNVSPGIAGSLTPESEAPARDR